MPAKGTEVAVMDAYSLPMDTPSVLALAGPGGTVLTVDDNRVGGIGSELAEAAAATPAPRLCVRSPCGIFPRADAPPRTSWPMSTCRWMK